LGTFQISNGPNIFWYISIRSQHVTSLGGKEGESHSPTHWLHGGAHLPSCGPFFHFIWLYECVLI
jgi:hypothetical protein